MQLRWVFAAVLALGLGAASAQTTAPAPPAGGDAAVVATPNADTSRADRLTTPKPALAPGSSLAPPAPPEATGAGSASATLPAPKDDGIGRMVGDTRVGRPVEGGYTLQPTVTDIGRRGRFLNDDVLEPVLGLVTLFVFGLIGYCIVAFRKRPGREPSRLSHNTTIEIAWTVIPVLILLGIAVPSFSLLADQYDPPKPDLVIKATGHQWYWEYSYPDQGGFSFDSVMLKDEDALKQGSPRLLDVDNRVVVPVGATVKVLTTGADVIHAWMVPAFWVQMDAVPGRINETWFKAEKTGVYYGQCYQLCGTRHAYMPIVVEVATRARYDAWIAAKQKENGITPKVTVAATTVGNGKA